MKSFLASLTALLLAGPALAQDSGDTTTADKPNPYLDTPPPELRRKLASLDPVDKEEWYRVEALVFARENPVTHEYWRLDQTPSFVANPIYLSGHQPSSKTPDAEDSRSSANGPRLPEEAGEIEKAAVDKGAWQPLAKKQLESRTLEGLRGRMENRGDYRILFHETWRQPIRKRSHAFAVHISGGKRLQPVKQEPTLTSMMPPEKGPAPLHGEDGDAAALTMPHDSLEAASDPGFPEMRGELKLYLARYLHVEPNLWLTAESGQQDRFHGVIEQHRRMRSEELHYIDHPLFGLLLYLEPWKTTAQQEADLMEQALEQQMERDSDN